MICYLFLSLQACFIDEYVIADADVVGIRDNLLQCLRSSVEGAGRPRASPRILRSKRSVTDSPKKGWFE